MAARSLPLSTDDRTSISKLSTLIGFVVVIASLYFGRRILIPLALALVFGFVFAPLVDFLERCKLSRVPSVLVVLLFSFLLLAGIGWVGTNQLVQVMIHLADYKENIHDKLDAIRSPGSGGLSKATATVNDLSKELTSASDAAANKKNGDRGVKPPLPVQVAAPPRTLNEYLRDSIGPLAGIVETAGIVVVFTLFILIKREDLRNRFFRLAGRGQLNVMTQAIDEASKRLTRYLFFQFVVNASYGVLFGMGLYFIGVPNPLLWGVACFLMRYIPYVGTLAAALFPTALAFAVFPGWLQAGLTLALFLLLELVAANFIEPWLYGAHTGVSSLAILVAAIFWGVLWGPVGLILSTPLTMCLILVGKYVPQLNFLEVVLGDEQVLSATEHFYQRLLALDNEEAEVSAQRYFKENGLLNTYDSMLIPALGLAEQDRHLNALEVSRSNFIYQSTRELIENLRELSLDPANVCEQSGEEDKPADKTVVPIQMTSIQCIPSRDEADEISGIMLAQVLEAGGHDARAMQIAPVATMLDRVAHESAEVFCVSALPPFAAANARTLCKQIRRRNPKARIILGLWNYPGGIEKATEKVGLGCADVIVTSLSQAVGALSADAKLTLKPISG